MTLRFGLRPLLAVTAIAAGLATLAPTSASAAPLPSDCDQGFGWEFRAPPGGSGHVATEAHGATISVDFHGEPNPNIWVELTPIGYTIIALQAVWVVPDGQGTTTHNVVEYYPNGAKQAYIEPNPDDEFLGWLGVEVVFARCPNRHASGGDLPETGSSNTTFVAIGAGLAVLAGAGLLLSSRRHNITSR